MAPTGQPKKPDVSAAAKERNEYIPSFIAKKPFYVPDTEDATSSGDYLEHQRLQSSSAQEDSKWYDRGKKLGPAATKFRKGACENCGAMTHKTKECLYRKRKAGARWTGKDIQADEMVQDVSLGWDAKRDRWNGYEARDYQAVVEEYNQMEDLKRLAQGEGKAADGDEDEDEGAKYEEEADMGRQQATSTRNLRLREDTAKYLLNLDLDSAKYDPKTRSMVDTGAVGSDAAGKLVAEEGFMRASGDAAEFERAQKYAWETQQRGDKNKIHLQANPTSGEVVRKKQLQEAEENREKHRKALVDKYGDQTQVQRAPLEKAVEESERYVEYDESGGIKGAPKIKAKSKYSEDVYINNHTSVWGSWWSNFQWGYACCHSTMKNSYCTGEEGKKAFEEASKLRAGLDTDEVPKQIAWKEEAALEEHVPNGTEDDRKSRRDENARKRAFEEMRDGVTEDDMEEYRRKKVSGNDPMAAMLGKNDIVT